MRFKDIPGHHELKAKLASSIKEHRIPHAQLFLGPEGSHNLSLAIACLQMMYCTQPLADDSCGQCSSCSKISKHSHPDVHYSYPTAGAKQISTTYINDWRAMLNEHPLMNASDWMSRIAKDENKTPNITREESRDILSKLSLKPFEGEAKALIIWMPEYLDKIGNSLLKIIEEPPQRTFFILVAHHFDSILPTVSSRTQLVKIGSYQNEEIVMHLRDRYNLEQSKAENIAFLADGNLREAVMMVEEVDDNYSELFRKMMLACYQNDLSTVSKITDELARLGRNQIQLYLQNGLKILRETLLYKTIDNYEIKFVGEYKEFIRNFSSTMNAKLIEESYHSINEAIYHIGRNSNAKISLFNLSLALRHNFIRKR